MKEIRMHGPPTEADLAIGEERKALAAQQLAEIDEAATHGAVAKAAAMRDSATETIRTLPAVANQESDLPNPLEAMGRVVKLGHKATARAANVVKGKAA